MFITANELFDKHPEVLEFIKERGTIRKYEIQDKLGFTRGETDLIVGILEGENLLVNSTGGWKYVGRP